MLFTGWRLWQSHTDCTVLQFISPLVVLFMFIVFNIHNHERNRLRKLFYWYTSLVKALEDFF